MAELSDLLEKIDENCNNIDKEIVIKAYDFAHEAHKDQMRESGEPYISHPLDVACILAEMGMDMSTIVAGILHDVIEDTSYSYDDITEMFSSEVADLVSGVTKLDKITYKTKEEQQADNVRKMLLAMAKDIRVILIKLADRLHNMRTLKFKREQKQREKAKETLDIYAPLAHRLGMSKIKWELEDLSFRYLKPKEYYELVDLIAEKRVEREEYISKIVDDLKSSLEASGIIPDIDGRPKHFYSIYRKMLNKSKSLDQIFDLTAVRILVNNIKECYAALGIVHTMYKPIPGRFKDYIAMPKPNMYQSLHSTVIGPEGKPFEIQIRTYDMHKTAEYGIAAHWKYKEGIVENPQNIPQSKSSNKDDTKLTWIREMLEWQRETPSAQEFMENFKIDLFSDEIFVFTPKGKVINLPYNATPVDFAYKIHTDVGNRCVGAKVNGKIVPLDYKLKTGEIVDILTTSLIKGPNINWLNSVTSNQAKSKIRSWFKKAKRDENISKGKELLEKESKKQEFNFGEIAKGENLDLVLKRYNMNSIDDLYASVGIGAVGASVILARFKDIYEKTKEHEHTNEEILENVKKNIHKENVAKKSYKNDQPGVTVKGVSDVLVRFAKCCTPVPGDPIIGYITKGRGVSVHRTDCTNVNNLIKEDGSRIIEVKWGKSKNESYIAEVEIKAEDRQALLADVVEVISYLEVGIESVNAKTSKGSMAYLNLKLKIQDIDHLAVLMQKLKRLPGIIDIYRTNS
ncbi:RelA/SpoT family protein [Clostridium felsineum]|uniref:GTP diphosphokinase n=1 Tax=Clostridium felsineum TaxID=36839 RepID=A0A1S8MHZ2_9CLOT|nr:bifunctional (p)ppGpp synthetase/guanosine-3',5'-bis(diphosphate) 3'-pyrophosphohydrolase [Clostridium felsineum]URZ07139.1 GTP pyrophosphokinase [Clostridium felsineum]URZ12169.1 GTP pyrophosphokinase [Clostridium felsineum]